MQIGSCGTSWDSGSLLEPPTFSFIVIRKVLRQICAYYMIMTLSYKQNFFLQDKSTKSPMQFQTNPLSESKLFYYLWHCL